MNDMLQIAIAQLREELARVEGEKAELEAIAAETPPSPNWHRVLDVEWDDEPPEGSGAIEGDVVLWQKGSEERCQFVGVDRDTGYWWAVHGGPRPKFGQPVELGRARSAREAMRQADAALGAS